MALCNLLNSCISRGLRGLLPVLAIERGQSEMQEFKRLQSAIEPPRSRPK